MMKTIGTSENEMLNKSDTCCSDSCSFVSFHKSLSGFNDAVLKTVHVRE